VVINRTETSKSSLSMCMSIDQKPEDKNMTSRIDGLVSTLPGIRPSDQGWNESRFFVGSACKHQFQSNDLLMPPGSKKRICNHRPQHLRDVPVKYMWENTREKVLAPQQFGVSMKQTGVVHEGFSRLKETGNWPQQTGSQVHIGMQTRAGRKRDRGGNTSEDLPSGCTADGRKRNKLRDIGQCIRPSRADLLTKRGLWDGRKEEYAPIERNKSTSFVRSRNRIINRVDEEMWNPSCLHQISVPRNNSAFSDQGTAAAYSNKDDSTSLAYTANTILIEFENKNQMECGSRSSSKINNTKISDDNCVMLNWHIKARSKEQVCWSLGRQHEEIQDTKLEEVLDLSGESPKRARLVTVFRNRSMTSVYHPCYIADNVEQVMSYMPLIDIIKAKRVSKVWQDAATSTLRRRAVDNLGRAPPLTPGVEAMLLSKVHKLLPRLRSLTINFAHLGQMKGAAFFHILKCKNLVFLRLEDLTWSNFNVATKDMLSVKMPCNHNLPTLCMLLELELPNATLPITTGTHCMKPLSKLFPNLHSLTIRSAQDMMIFSLRLFFPSVRNLFMLDTLWTTRKFAQIISSTPKLMKFLRQGEKFSIATPKVTYSSGTKIYPFSRQIPKELRSVLHSPRMHKTGSVPVTPSDDRLTALISNRMKSLDVEPLGRVRMIETGKDLTKTNIGMFAAFCALIGVMIIMPPLD